MQGKTRLANLESHGVDKSQMYPGLEARGCAGMRAGDSAGEMYWTTPSQKTGDSHLEVGCLRMQAALRVLSEETAPPQNHRCRPLRSGNGGGGRASISNDVAATAALTPSLRRSVAASQERPCRRREARGCLHTAAECTVHGQARHNRRDSPWERR